MEIIKTITDLDIIGEEGMSDSHPRITARAILMNSNNQYAFIHTDGFGIYAFVGGGVEKDENIIEALIREVFEETGCSCDSIAEIGCVAENRTLHSVITIILLKPILSNSVRVLQMMKKDIMLH